MLHGLDLFSGIGGITLGLSRWVRPIAYCEIEAFCEAVLIDRMADGKLPRAPIWDDVKTLDGKPFKGFVDIITAGFPCQDISVANADANGLAGERSGLVTEVYRLADEIEPAFIFFENVPAIRTRGLSSVVKKLASLGYDSRWCMLSAFDCGAPHQRTRWFLLANRNSQGLEIGLSEQGDTRTELKAAIGSRSGQGSAFRRKWSTESSVLRISHGIAHRAHRIKAIGGGVVPLQVETAFKLLMGIS